jgi:two-component system sensor histidine kinase MtrB
MKGAAASSSFGSAPPEAVPSRGQERAPGPEPFGTARRHRVGPVVVRAPDVVRRLRRLAGRHAAVIRRRFTAAHGVLRARWLRSLQLRVVTTTLLISAVVVSVLGFFLMQQITSDQLKAKEGQAGTVVDAGQISAEAESGVDARPNGPGTQQLMYSIARNLQPQSAAGSQSDYRVAIMLAPGYGGPPVYGLGWTDGIVPGQIPARLVSKVDSLQKKGRSPVSYTPGSMSYPSPSSRPIPGLVYGVPVRSYYQLYYFFPLTQVQQSLALIQRTLMVAGLALVFLFAAIAALVTRWVVAPVRQASHSAQRLSAGNLGERMPVRGADELAALARSFNEMATSLQDKMTALEDLSQVQRLFVSDVSHELRTPLTTIRFAADLLFESREQFDGPVGRSAELLQSQLERFETLLTDLLEISRYDANVAVLDPEPVDVCNLARQAADVAQQLAERRGAKIEFRLPAEPCVADVDRCRVERILRNLLVNAVEHGEGKDAVVTVAGDSASVAVSVRDYGIGLAAGQERLVFDRFWRADPARARTTGGTGLGLAIALEDARIHGGWLEAWGEPGRGSVFRLTLPREVGTQLAGSPLPLGPDQAEVAGAVAGVRLAGGHAPVCLIHPADTVRLTHPADTVRLADAAGPVRPADAAPAVRLADENGSGRRADGVPAVSLADGPVPVPLADGSSAAGQAGLGGNTTGVVTAAGGAGPAAPDGPGQ